MVIESASSEGESKFDADARWWLNGSGGDAEIALTIWISLTRREIIMEDWGMAGRPTRAEPSKNVPQVGQRAVISQVASEQPIRASSDQLGFDLNAFSFGLRVKRRRYCSQQSGSGVDRGNDMEYPPNV